MTDLSDTLPGQTPFDRTGLEHSSIQTKEELDALEAQNILRARTTLLKKKRREGWFSVDFIKRVHRRMLGDIWSWAGEFRGRNFEPTLGIPFFKIPEEVELLCRDVAYWGKMNENKIPLLEQAARIHHRLVQIHPFRNGNGRHARLVSDIFLYAHQHPLPEWPNENLASPVDARNEYIQALQKADRGDIAILLSYTQRYVKYL